MLQSLQTFIEGTQARATMCFSNRTICAFQASSAVYRMYTIENWKQLQSRYLENEDLFYINV